MDHSDDGTDDCDDGMDHGDAFDYGIGFEEYDDVAAMTRALARKSNDETEVEADSDPTSESDSEPSSGPERDTLDPAIDISFDSDQISVNQGDVQMKNAVNHQIAPQNSSITSNVVGSLQAFKNVIDGPLQFNIKESSDCHLNSQQKSSIDFHSLMSPERVDRQTQRDLL